MIRIDSIKNAMVLVILSIPWSAQGADAKDDPKSDPPWLRMCNEGVNEHRIAPLKNSTQPFKKLEHPVLIHSQSVRDDQLGAVYLWVSADKRPAVIADAVVAPDPERPGTHYFVQEFHSLAPTRIVGTLTGGRRWAPSGPGIEWQQVLGMDNKPKSEKLMVIQSRVLTRDLKAHGIDWRRENQRHEYRVLSKPLYTYTTTNNGESVVGCVFAICLAIDPEIIVCIEARTNDNTTKWYRAFAGFSDMHIFVEEKGETIWKEDPPRFSFSGPHCAIGKVNLRLPSQ